MRQRNDLYRIKQLKTIKGEATTACEAAALKSIVPSLIANEVPEDNQLINL